MNVGSIEGVYGLAFLASFSPPSYTSPKNIRLFLSILGIMPIKIGKTSLFF